ncbi:MAG: hypothetical protein K8H84_05040 [Sulfuricella denitrificans]|nr:hypothetical protein [Sulfuricella denitrificans]
MKTIATLGLIIFSLSGCCTVACNSRPANSHIQVNSNVLASCSFEDKAGLREFYAPGKVDGMPKNAPGTLTCQAEGHKIFHKQVLASDWGKIDSLSDDPRAIRYFGETTVTMEKHGN